MLFVNCQQIKHEVDLEDLRGYKANFNGLLTRLPLHFYKDLPEFIKNFSSFRVNRQKEYHACKRCQNSQGN